MENPVPAYAIQSVDNALQLLLILQRDGVLRVSDAATELNVARSTAHRLISMLRFRGFVEQAADRSYHAGNALGAMSAGKNPAAILHGVVRPHLTTLTGKVNESSNVAIIIGAEVQFIDTVEANQALRVGSRVGVRMPARLTSVGKVLLAELPSEEIAALHPQFPPDSPELLTLLRQLGTTRRQGFGTNFEESERGVLALAMPIRDAYGTAVGAVSISAPSIRFKRTQILDLLPQLTQTVTVIREDLIRT